MPEPDSLERYQERVEAAEASRKGGFPDAATDILRRAMADAMTAGLYFAYADLAPLQRDLIRIEHGPDVQDGAWRFEGGRALRREDAPYAYQDAS